MAWNLLNMLLSDEEKESSLVIFMRPEKFLGSSALHEWGKLDRKQKDSGEQKMSKL